MSPTYKRWYDHDPLLLEVIELLRNYQTELRAQAEIFLQKIENDFFKTIVVNIIFLYRWRNDFLYYKSFTSRFNNSWFAFRNGIIVYFINNKSNKI